MRETIESYCKKLKLGTTIPENYPQIEADTHEEFLEKLLRLEVEQREINRKNRLLKQANFPTFKTFKDYNFDNVALPESIDVETLKTAGFVEQKENLILYGPVGTGKTFMSIAVGIEACNRGKKVMFYTTAALVNQLLEAQADGEINKLMKKIEKADVLICDEWGYIPLNTEGAQLLFQVISNCYEKRSVIITTNLEFSKWNSIFFDEKLTSAIIDRLVHYSHLITFTGPSYRLQNSYINC